MRKYLISAAILITFVIGAYYLQFGHSLKYEIAKNPERWGQLGDYLGGLLNPALSFITLCLLIETIKVQNSANKEITKDIKNREKTEQLRSFETLFFNLLKTHLESFEKFEITTEKNKKQRILRKNQAVEYIEKRIEAERKNNPNCDQSIKSIIENLDENDSIYSIARTFSNIIKITSTRLSNNEIFTCEERKSYMQHLINHTNFSHYRLLLIAIQFLDYPQITSLKENREFISLLNELGTDISSY